jgi:dTMP kinase
MTGRGFFISFEGGEGSGKTTQINKLSEALAARNFKVTTTREPGGTEEGELIRNLVVQRNSGDWSAMSECLLLFAARSIHVDKVIKPALEDGHVVISDRFTDSTYAYQGYGRGMKLAEIKKLEKLVLGKFKPDLTFILDIDPQSGLSRSDRRLASEEIGVARTEDRFERMQMDFHEKIRRGFLTIAKKDRKRCVVINAAQPVDALADQIAAKALERLK